jgi:hypothetical protein
MNDASPNLIESLFIGSETVIEFVFFVVFEPLRESVDMSDSIPVESTGLFKVSPTCAIELM